MRCIRFINKAAAVNFFMMYDSNIVLKDGNVETLLQSFNNHCFSALDKVALLKPGKIPSTNSFPWINENIQRKLKCCMTERL